MSDKVVYGIVGFVMGFVVAVLLAQSFVNNNQTGMMRMMGIRYNTGSTGVNASTMDAHFIEQMIPHHEDAITMAKLAQTRAKKVEVKQLAQNIIDSQGKEIDQMKVWYKDWFGKDVPKDTRVMRGHAMGQSTRMHMGMMGDNTDLERLSSAADFDKAFVEEMIPHHQMAVMMASMLKNSTERPEMKKLADDIVAAQTKEIDQMRGWLKDWNN